MLDSGYRVELGFLAVASLVAFTIPATGQISLLLGFALLGFFVFYLWRVSQAEAEEPDLVGPAATIGSLPQRPRRVLVVVLFAFAAVVIVASAEPFAQGLIATGRQLGVDEFLLVQWLAPLASEAPEFIVAILFAVRGKAGDAIGTLISSKVTSGRCSSVACRSRTWPAEAGPAASRSTPARSRSSCSPPPRRCSVSPPCSRCDSPAGPPGPCSACSPSSSRCPARPLGTC